MPAISRRRGSAASFFGGEAGLAFCSGGNLRTGSAILLFFLGKFFGRLVSWILDRVADVLLDRFQLGEQAMRIGGIDAVERGRSEFGAQAGQFAEQRPCGLAQIEPVDAAVAVVA